MRYAKKSSGIVAHVKAIAYDTCYSPILSNYPIEQVKFLVIAPFRNSSRGDTISIYSERVDCCTRYFRPDLGQEFVINASPVDFYEEWQIVPIHPVFDLPMCTNRVLPVRNDIVTGTITKKKEQTWKLTKLASRF